MNFRSSHGIYLDFHWRTKEPEKKVHFELADRAFETLVKGGMSQKEAKETIEQLWSNGYRQGYDESAFDHQDPI